MNLQKMASAARTYLSDWRWGPFFLQRRFRRRAHRDVGARIAARLGARSPLPVARADEALTSCLLDEGQARLGRLLSESECREAMDFLTARRVSDVYRPQVRPWLPLSDGRHPHSHVGYHDHADVVRAPHLLRLANRPEILAVVESFLGCTPTIAYLAAWWSYSTEIGAQHAEKFHRDVDDWRFVKLFVYLTDVDENKGPHVYVKRSAILPDMGPIRRYEDDEIGRAFPAHDIVYMTGSAGQGFLENTFGLHKGQPVAQGHRLLFQAVYSIMPLPYGPKRPVIGAVEAQALAASPIDPFVNRVYVARTGGR